MRECGFEFQVYTEPLEENFPPDMAPHKVAEYLACEKNRYYRKVLKEAIILTADTTVVLLGAILNKPADENEAFKMLSALSGNTHEVITGVCISHRDEAESFADTTRVTFKKLKDEQIDFYIKNYQPFDKAGAYGIQEWIGMVGIERIEGSYFNVVGLPINRVYEKLEKFVSV